MHALLSSIKISILALSMRTAVTLTRLCNAQTRLRHRFFTLCDMQKSHELAHLFNAVDAQDCHQPSFPLHFFMLGLTNITFILDLILLLNVIKIQILVGAVVKVQLSFWNFCCYIVCQIKEGMLV